MNGITTVPAQSRSTIPSGGEMGALVRATDWSRTPFGPIERWPQSLKTATALMLESGFAMVVAWGEEFRFLYNDRYRPILGNKHPFALGAAACDIFPEVWDELIGPLFKRTRRGETVAMDDLYIPLHRHGYLENCYFSIAYSPIRDESGGVGGMLAVVAETTERVEGERRLATLRDLARRAADAQSPEAACTNAAGVLALNPIDVPFAILYLVGEDGRAHRIATAGAVDGPPGQSPITLQDRAAREASEAPAAADAEERAVAWPLADVLRTGKSVVVDDVVARLGEIASAPYPEPVTTAVALPLSRPGAAPYGFLVVAVSARKALNDAYRDFFTLAAEHITTAIANARALEEERRRADALAEIDRAKTAFFSNVSHEFRTPLTLMLGPIEELLARPPGTALGELRGPLEVAHRNSLRLLKLVNTLLDFSRLEAGRLSATYEPVDLAAFTAELASVFRAAVEKAGLRLRIECPPLHAPAYVDRDLWEKIVFNLLSNALKFTLAGEIAISVRRIGESFELAVSDTGVGIPERELPNLFKRFYRIENVRSRTHEGTGIGLALVQELARLHGGTVRVTSRPGEGSTFTISIPAGRDHLPEERVALTADEAGPYLTRHASSLSPIKAESFVAEALRWVPGGEEPPHPGAAGREAAGARSGRPDPSVAERIVLADDNADMRDYVRRLLGRYYRVDAFADGEAALEAIRRDPPQLVLTDVMMPRLDGFGLLQAIRDDAALQGLPVIILSARAGQEASVSGYEAGADDYLVKPFTARELFVRVGSHLKLARLRKAIAEQTEQLLVTEARSEQLIHLVPAPVCVCDAEGRVTFFNRRLAELLTVEPRIGQRWEEFARQFKLFAADGTRSPLAAGPVVQAIARRRAFHDVEIEVDRPDGTRFIGCVSVEPITKPGGASDGVIMICQDITGRKREEWHAATLGRLAQELPLLVDEDAIVMKATQIVGEHLGVQRCYFVEAAPDGRRAFIRRHWLRDPVVPSLQGAYDFEDFGSSALRDAMAGGIVAVDATREHPLTRNHAGSFERLAMGAFATAPYLRDGGWSVALAVAEGAPRTWRPDELSFLQSATARIWPIVERARVTAALRENEQASRRLAAIVESSNDAIYGTTNDGVITTWNSGAQRLFGYESDEIVGRPVETLIPADRRHEERELVERVRRGERIGAFETVRCHKDGRPVEVSLTFSLIRSRDGATVGISKIARDISDRRRAEALQRAVYDMLVTVNRASALGDIYEAALTTIVRCLECARAAILLRDEDGRMRVAASRALTEQAVAVLPAVAPWAADAAEPGPIVEENLDTSAASDLRDGLAGIGVRALAIVPLSYERRLSGELMVLYDAPHRCAPRELEVAQAVASQVAFAVERQKGAEALEALVDERTRSLRQAVTQMEEFSYSVSHDLRSPVRAMRGYAEVLLQDYASRLDEPGRDMLTRIHRNGLRMERLIQDLLTYTRIARREMPAEAVSLQALVREVVQQYPEMHPDRAQIEIEGTLPGVLAHEPSLTQVVSNLLSNAVKFVAPGTRPRVTVRAERDGDRVRLWIRDNGIGITPENQARLFAMFERVHLDPRYEGTGIGLAIVRKAVERMNGRVGMASDGRSGSEFWIELPAAD
jgi:PAS domain S-box-containing protein